MMTQTSISQSDRRFRLAFVAVCLFALSASAFAGAHSLQELRVGTHRGYDRAVFQLDAATDYTVEETTQGKLSVKLRDADPAPEFALPDVPENLDAIRGFEAYRLGGTDLEIEIILKNHFYYTAFVLDSPWRLVVDCSLEPIQPPSDANKPAKTKEPEYVPGDRPIETTFADAQQTPEVVESPADSAIFVEPEVYGPPAELASITTPQPETTQPEVTEPEFPEPELVETTVADNEATTDPAKVRSVLHQFYLAMGDTERAMEFSDSPELASETQKSSGDSIDYLARAVSGVFLAMPWLIFVVAFFFGLGGGFAALWLHSRLRGGVTDKPSRYEAPGASESDPVARDLEQDIDALDEAVKSEPAKPEPAPEPEAPAEPQAEAPDEEQLKETAMDRRVKRVLELSKGGHDIQSIAKQLEMSQDEVKLILDLNPHTEA